MSKEPNSTVRVADDTTSASPSPTSTSARNTSGPQSGTSRNTDSNSVTREQLVEDLQRTVSDARKYLEQLGEHGKERARVKRDEAHDQLEHWRAQGEDIIRQKPFTAVAVALAVGWVIGKLGD